MGRYPKDYQKPETNQGDQMQTNETMPADVRVQTASQPAKNERYYKVRFSAKTHANDQEDVELSVNGEVLRIQREKIVIIPERYKECADNATYQTFQQLPGRDRKVTGRIKIFPYDLLGDATEAEFIAMKIDGTQKERKSAEEKSI